MNKNTFFLALLVTVLISSCASMSNKSDESIEGPPVEGKSELPKIGVQLWSVKEFVKNDFEGTLTSLATMGFDGVEFAGDFGPYNESPSELKSFLEGLGLVGCGAHVHFDKLTDDKLSQTIAFYKAAGVNTLIIPWEERSWHPQGVKEVVAELNELAKKLAPHNMSIGYHNHNHEFDSYEDATYWDYIARNTTANVVLQQDVGWTALAGKDPVEYVRRYPGRTWTTHYKIRLHDGVSHSQAIIGQDNMIDWPALAKANVEVGGTHWIVVEQELYPEGMTPMQSVSASKAALDVILSEL